MKSRSSLVGGGRRTEDGKEVSNSVVGGGDGAGGAEVNSRGRSPRYVPPNDIGPERAADRRKVCLDELVECAASERAKCILMLKTVLLGPVRADVVWGERTGGFAPGY